MSPPIVYITLVGLLTMISGHLLPTIFIDTSFDDWWLKPYAAVIDDISARSLVVSSSAVCGYLVERLPLSSSICHPLSNNYRYICYITLKGRVVHGAFRTCLLGNVVWLCQFLALGLLDFSCSYRVGAFYFSFAKLVQAAFCKYWSLAPDSCSKYRQPSAFSSSRQGWLKKMWFSKILLVIPCIYMPSPCLLL